MRGKRAKRERREMKEMMELLEPLAPILPLAHRELEGDEELLAKWTSIAVGMHAIHPEIPLHELLPNVLDATFEKYEAKFLKSLNQIEYTP